MLKSLKSILFFFSGSGWIGVSIFFGLMLLAGCGTPPVIQDTSSSPYHTGMVLTGGVTEHATHIGYVEPTQQTVLSTEAGGTLTHLSVDEGTEVSAGMVIAHIDTNELSSQYKSVQHTIQSLQHLLRSTAKTFDAQIKTAQNKVNQAQTAMDMAQIGEQESEGTADKQLKQIELQIDQYRTQLSQQKTILAVQQLQLYKNAITSLQQSRVGLEAIGNFLDQLVGISQSKQQYNDAYEIYLGAKNTALTTDVKQQRSSLNKKYAGLSERMMAYQHPSSLSGLNSQTMQDIDLLLEDMQVFLKDVRTLLDTTYSMIDASVSSARLPQARIEEYKNIVIGMQEQVEKMLLTAQGDFLLGIQGSAQAIDTFREQKEHKITSLEQQLLILQQQYEAQQDQSKKQYDIAKEQYQEALGSLDVIKQQKETKLAEIRTQLSEAEGQKYSLEVQIENATIHVPFDGIIIQKHAHAGQFVGPGTPLVSIAVQDSYEIDVAVPLRYQRSFAQGDQLPIVLPELDQQYTGTIISIAPQADHISRKVQYTLQFQVPGSQNDLPFGIYAEIRFPIDYHTGAYLDRGFVQYRYGDAFVYVQDLSGTGAIYRSGYIDTQARFQQRYIDISYCATNLCIVSSGLVYGDVVMRKVK